MKLTCLTIVGLVVAVSGCGDSGTGNKETLAARYELRVVGGRGLPITTWSATFGSGKLEVVGGALVPVSRGMLLDIVTYQGTSPSGVKEPVFADTVSVPYVFANSRLTLTRTRPDDSTVEEVWTHTEGVLTGSRTFRSNAPVPYGPTTANYVAKP